MIRLSYKGEAIFRVIRDCSPNELTAIQSIAHERVTPENFQYVSGLPQATLASLVNKNLVVIGG